MTVNDNLNTTLLVADSTIGTYGFDVERIAAATQVLEPHTMQQGITVAPVVVKSFHPVHELQAFSLVIVTCGKLDGNVVLAIGQFNLVTLVEGLGQYDTAIVFMSCLNFLFTNKQLGQHDTWQRLLVILAGLTYPVDTIKTAKDYHTVVARHDSTHVELIALQSVVDAVVVESVVEGSVFMVTLYNHTADTIAGRNPDVVISVLGYTADGVIAESVFLRQVA